MSKLAPEARASGDVARKTALGAFSLGIRQILVQGTRVLAGVFLARLLTPKQFGIFAIVLYFQTFLAAFGDAGLAASLIRQHEEPEIADYRAVFTIQQILVFAIVLGMWIFAPRIASAYRLQSNDIWLFRIIALSFLVTSFTVIPVIQLERRLAFDKVSMIESSQAVIFNIVVVFLAWRGFGSYAFVYALLAGVSTGALLANYVCRWKIGWRWDWSLILSHMSFGIPFQGIQVASLLKDSISPVFIGVLLGAADVGYITWAMMIAAYPAMILFVLQRLYMPAFARLQQHQAELISLTENVIWGANAITAPLAILTLAMITPITVTVYGAKWLTALPYFYLFWLTNLLVPTAAPAMSLLNALGKSKITLLFAFLWMAGTWLIGAPLILLYGVIGFAIANLIVTLSDFWLYRVAQRQIPFRIFTIVMPTWIIASLTGAFIYLLCRVHPPLYALQVGVYGASGLLVYGGGMYLFYRQKIHAALAAITGVA